MAAQPWCTIGGLTHGWNKVLPEQRIRSSRMPAWQESSSIALGTPTMGQAGKGSCGRY